MPGIGARPDDLELDGLTGRLAALLHAAVTGLEARASDSKTTPEAIARGVGVAARAGVALLALNDWLARRRAAEADETEEADMDDLEPAGDADLAHDAADIERGLRNLARNLELDDPADDDVGSAGPGGAYGAGGELGLPGAQAPVGA